jgi:hypothetical protein
MSHFAILILGAVLVLLAPSPCAATDPRRFVTEDLFEQQMDMSGTYPMHGSFLNGGEYKGTMTLTLRHRVTMPHGFTINVYDVVSTAETWTNLPGLAVQGGNRLFIAQGGEDNFGLVLLGTIKYTQEEWEFHEKYRAMQDEVDSQNRGRSILDTRHDWHYVKLKGPSPWWFRLLNTNFNADYGFWFYTDGTWGEVSHNAVTDSYGNTNEVSVNFRELYDNGEPNEAGWHSVRKAVFSMVGSNSKIEFANSDGSTSQAFGMELGESTGSSLDRRQLLVAILDGAKENSLESLEYRNGQFEGEWISVPDPRRGDDVLEIPAEVTVRNPAFLRNDLEDCERGNAFICSDLGAKTKGRRAVEFYQKGCDGGDGWGCFLLGSAYQEGQDSGVEQDLGRAASAFQKACDLKECLNCAYSCDLLGHMYEDGTGVEKDPAKALELYKQGCQTGKSEASCKDVSRLK